VVLATTELEADADLAGVDALFLKPGTPAGLLAALQGLVGDERK
jgi:hypothetical protein